MEHLTQANTRPIAILAYHQIAPAPRRGTPVRSLFLPGWRFALQLRALKLLGWRGLSIRDLEPYLAGRQSGKVFGITLDDGYLNTYERALPTLLELGFTATTFVVSAQIGGTNAWDHDQGAVPAPLMGVDHLRGWIAAGMEVGAHTRHHVHLCRCDAATARSEIEGSKRELEDSLGVPVRSFCYPYGEHRAEHAEMARRAGYVNATTTVSSRAHPGRDDPMRLPRISIELHTNLPVLVARVTTGIRRWEASRGTRVAGANPAQHPPLRFPEDSAWGQMADTVGDSRL
ncbi:polysaccharide deacetylase family protein [Ramlibacter humi]|uniref:Polysaccharide deacetylase family protein n=1 Tax=Ramlibacter humi TaxID=2530451 RepID=A0A4Z0BBT5_9BURK|nr:polysaccharide deacetylase family protein [Ramlibacter humi]TFY96645.1 polysaccharide deacetylase family protein [Ramlibacter humi]